MNLPSRGGPVIDKSNRSYTQIIKIDTLLSNAGMTVRGEINSISNEIGRHMHPCARIYENCHNTFFLLHSFITSALISLSDLSDMKSLT
ncbi:MAG: hypothetical protein ACD_47C00256G0004 [uncultured bacterium]|nr:MAG: hypothetical protein ACD_47C00256G0004 [uncultured bacterium]